MKKPIPWFEPSFDADDAEAVRKVVASGFVNQGPENDRLQKMLVDQFEVCWAVTFPSCTTALAASLMACGVKPGDVVLVPDITFVGTASAVRLARAEPVPVDVSRETLTIDPEGVRRAIRREDRTSAVIAVHLNGLPADTDALRRVTEEESRYRRITLVEDCAQAMLCEDGLGRTLGTEGDVGCYSLAPTKIVTAGQGGFALTDNATLYERMIRLKDHGRFYGPEDEHREVGFNFKFTDVQAALTFSQWRHLYKRIDRRREIARLYHERLADCEHVDTSLLAHGGAHESVKARSWDQGGPTGTDEGSGGYRLWPAILCRWRDELCSFLEDRGIRSRKFWPAIHTLPPYRTNGSFPVAERAAACGLFLPCAIDVTDEQVERACKAVREFYEVNARALPSTEQEACK